MNEHLSDYHFILASTSPRRRELLEILGSPFAVIAPGSVGGVGEVDETPLPDEPPDELVQRLSRIKAETVAHHLPSLLPALPVAQINQIIVIAADTVVVFDHKILGKPRDPAEAIEMLTLLRQRPQEVYSGLTIAYVPQTSAAYPAPLFITRLQRSTVWMRPYSQAEIAAYVATGSPLDKAGAYGIQDQPFAPVERLAGCFASIMGFPLAELAQALAEIGLSLPAIGPLCSQHIGTTCCQQMV
jgi:MAF protein